MDMIKINYSKRNINIISFFISLIIFLLLIFNLKYLSLKYNQKAQNKPNIVESLENKEENIDICLEEIKEWQIEIEKLNLIAQIREGTSEEIIKESVGHFTTSNLLYGNIALKAYNIGPYKNYFANLKELEIGDEIEYKINNMINGYEVVANLIIDKESEGEYISKNINNSNEKDRLILITYIKDMEENRRCVVAEKKGGK